MQFNGHAGRIGFLASWIVLAGCGGRFNDTSGVQEGHLVGMTQLWTINVLPNQTISFCGEYGSEARDAFRQFAAAVKRDTSINMVVTEMCQEKTDDVVMVRSKLKSPTARSLCNARPGDIAVSSGNYGFIAICQPIERKLLDAILLHELGHQWGLCDQYEPAASLNCDPSHKGRTDNYSVMGNGWLFSNEYPTELTESDLRGMRDLAARRDIRANAVWEKLVGHPSSWSNLTEEGRCLSVDELMRMAELQVKKIDHTLDKSKPAWSSAEQREYSGLDARMQAHGRCR